MQNGTLDGPHTGKIYHVAQQRDVQSDGLHSEKNDQTAQQSDLRSDELHPHGSCEKAQKYDARSGRPLVSKFRKKLLRKLSRTSPI